MRLSAAVAYLFAAILFAVPLFGQAKTQDTHRSDFDYLLGDWEFTGMNQQYGKTHGFWSAVRLGENGPILDEYRIVGDAGETYYVTSTLRAYNGRLGQWELVSTEGASGLQNAGTGKRDGTEMHIEQTFGAGTPNQSVWRIRYFNIQPDHFSWSADRSTDGGKTWAKEFQRLEAKRVGPARSPLTLTTAQRPKQ